MPIRNTTHILKNSDIVNRPLPSSLLKGEAIVNTADGIVYFSGVTTSTSEWTPAGTGTTANFFEVGSNLYDLRLRNQITQYQGESGGDLVGKFLSGTTSGFVLADISDIAATTDSYLTGATWNPNQLTLDLNLGKPSVSINIDAFSALTITGDLFVEGELTTNDLTITGTATYNSVANGSDNNELVNWSSLTGYTSTNDKYVTGGTYDNNTALITFSGANNFPSFTVDLSTIDVNDTFVTGGTVSYDPENLNGTLTLRRNDGNDVTVTGFTDVQTTGATLVGDAVFFDTNESLSAYTLDLSALDVNDTFSTGFTYNPSNNTFTISRNEGQPNLTAVIDTVSGLTVSNLTAGRVVYVGTGGLLTDEAGFTYDAGTNTFSVPSDGTVNVGTGGLNVEGDAVIQGSLTVFGPSISAFTSELYVEDPNITLNYNPTGSTIATSVGAGWTIKDGNGITGGSVNLDIVRLQNLTGLTATNIPDVTEYTALTGYANRGWITQLNDIVIRSTDVTDGGSAGDINGVRVLAEFDILDGGTY